MTDEPEDVTEPDDAGDDDAWPDLNPDASGSASDGDGD